MDGEDFTIVLLPGLDGEFVQADVEELYRTIAGRDEDLVLVRLRPGEVEEGVLGIEPGVPDVFSHHGLSSIGDSIWTGAIALLPFFGNDALGRQAQYVEAAIAHEAEIRCRGYGDARIEEGGVFDGVAIETLSAVFEHLKQSILCALGRVVSIMTLKAPCC